jgi:protocatechuate 3,4-dioxygenase, alpha subunit
MIKQTPSQTVGPFFAYGLTPEQSGYPFTSLFPPVLAEGHAAGTHIKITGRVFDGADKTIPDALIEIAHVDAAGQPVTSREQANARGFRGFGRSATGAADHSFAFHTVKPGAATAGEAPHVNLIVTMRGMLVHAFTRLYFDDEQEANARDPVLGAVPAERRATLIARREEVPGGLQYRFDIHMQGPRETVFFDL